MVLPDEYTVTIETIDGRTIKIHENNYGVIVSENYKEILIKDTNLIKNITSWKNYYNKVFN